MPTRSVATRTRSGCSANVFGTPRRRSAIRGSTELERRVPEIAAWTSTLPRSGLALRNPRRRSGRRSTLAVRWGTGSQNPAKLAGANRPARAPRGVETFTLCRGRPRLADELGPRLRPHDPASRPLQECVLRNGWRSRGRDVRQNVGPSSVSRRTVVDGRAKPYGKTGRLPSRGAAVVTRCVGTRSSCRPAGSTRGLLFPAPRGAHINLRNFRKREWIPALDVAGVPPAPLYDLRSTFASHARSQPRHGVRARPLIMGTSRADDRAPTGSLLQALGPDSRPRQARRPTPTVWGQERATGNQVRPPLWGPHSPTRGYGVFPGFCGDGRYWARTSDPQLVELVLSQLS